MTLFPGIETAERVTVSRRFRHINPDDPYFAYNLAASMVNQWDFVFYWGDVSSTFRFVIPQIRPRDNKLQETLHANVEYLNKYFEYVPGQTPVEEVREYIRKVIGQ